MEKDENTKLKKFQDCEQTLLESAKKKNRPEGWEEMDDAEQEER